MSRQEEVVQVSESEQAAAAGIRPLCGVELAAGDDTDSDCVSVADSQWGAAHAALLTQIS